MMIRITNPELKRVLRTDAIATATLGRMCQSGRVPARFRPALEGMLAVATGAAPPPMFEQNGKRKFYTPEFDAEVQSLAAMGLKAKDIAERLQTPIACVYRRLPPACEGIARRREQVRRLFEGGMTARGIAHQIGTCMTTVRNDLAALGFDLEAIEAAQINQRWQQVRALHQAGHTRREIATQLKMSISGVRQIILNPRNVFAGRDNDYTRRRRAERLALAAKARAMAAEGMPTAEIATRLGRSLKHTQTYLREGRAQ